MAEALRFKEERSRKLDWKSQQGHAEETRSYSEGTGEPKGMLCRGMMSSGLHQLSGL